MNVAVHPRAIISAKPLSETRRSQRLRLGMPQLSLDGLSETWLLKEAGDIHWQLIAGLAVRERPEFRDETGEPVYAAFCAAFSAGLALGRFQEHDELVVISMIQQVSRTRFASRHELMLDDEPAGPPIFCLSSFVGRAPVAIEPSPRCACPSFRSPVANLW